MCPPESDWKLAAKNAKGAKGRAQHAAPLLTASAFFRWQQKQSPQRPNAADGAGNDPDDFIAAAVIGDDAAENRVEQMHQCGGSQQSHRLHFRFDENQAGEVSEQLVEFHERPLTLPSDS